MIALAGADQCGPGRDASPFQQRLDGEAGSQRLEGRKPQAVGFVFDPDPCEREGPRDVGPVDQWRDGPCAEGLRVAMTRITLVTAEQQRGVRLRAFCGHVRANHRTARLGKATAADPHLLNLAEGADVVEGIGPEDEQVGLSTDCESADGRILMARGGVDGG